MKAKELKKDLRVEYSAKVSYVDSNGLCRKESHQFVGYVKHVFRKWFRTYVAICESKTRRIDIIPLKDIFGTIEPRLEKSIKAKLSK